MRLHLLGWSLHSQPRALLRDSPRVMAQVDKPVEGVALGAQVRLQRELYTVGDEMQLRGAMLSRRERIGCFDERPRLAPHQNCICVGLSGMCLELPRREVA